VLTSPSLPGAKGRRELRRADSFKSQRQLAH